MVSLGRIWTFRNILTPRLLTSNNIHWKWEPVNTIEWETLKGGVGGGLHCTWRAQIAQLVQWLGYGMDDPGFESRQQNRFFFSPKYPEQLWYPFNLPFNWYHNFFPGDTVARAGHNADYLTTDLHLVLRLRMSGVIPLQPQYAFMSCKGTALPSNCTWCPICNWDIPNYGKIHSSSMNRVQNVLPERQGGTLQIAILIQASGSVLTNWLFTSLSTLCTFNPWPVKMQ